MWKNEKGTIGKRARPGKNKQNNESAGKLRNGFLNNQADTYDHARFIRELLAAIFNFLLASDGSFLTVMVISPYLQQVQLIQTMAMDLAQFEASPASIQFRTVDSAMGSEADLVIYDNPRTDKPGFTGDAERLNVSHTRARLGEFVVYTSKVLDNVRGFFRGHLFTLCEDAFSHEAVVNFDKGKWDFRCTICTDTATPNLLALRRRMLTPFDLAEVDGVDEAGDGPGAR